MTPAPRAPAPEGSAVFVYDERALLGEAAGWLGGGLGALGGVRGRLFRGPRGRLGLVPEPGGALVRGRVVEVLAAQLPILDFLLAGVGGGLVRRPVLVVVNLRSVQAAAWVLIDPFGWKPVKQESP